MEQQDYSKQIENIFRKILQVIRIKGALELRRQDWITKLKISDDYQTTVFILNSLLEVYKRELKVMEYSKKGIKKARETLAIVQNETIGPKSSFSLAKATMLMGINRIVPLYGKVFQNPETLENLSIVLWNDANHILVLVEQDLEIIEKLLFKQYAWVSAQIGKSKTGNLVANVTWDDSYKDFEIIFNRELQINFRIKKGTLFKKLRYKIIKTAQRVDIGMGQRPALSKIQGITYLLTSSEVAWTTSLYFLEGPLVFCGVACFACVRLVAVGGLVKRIKAVNI